MSSRKLPCFIAVGIPFGGIGGITPTPATTWDARVERLCPGSKVEVFGEQPRTGWMTWGSVVSGLLTGRSTHVGAVREAELMLFCF